MTRIPLTPINARTLSATDQGPPRANLLTSLAGKWILANTRKFTIRILDPDQQLFGKPKRLRLDAATFEIKRRIYAAPRSLGRPTVRLDLESAGSVILIMARFSHYQALPRLCLKELKRAPSYFNREVASLPDTWWS